MEFISTLTSFFKNDPFLSNSNTESKVDNLIVPSPTAPSNHFINKQNPSTTTTTTQTQG
jgi:hypothetical protein